MQSKLILSPDDVKKVAAAAAAEALANNWNVTLAIVNDEGRLLWLQRLDGAAPWSAFVAMAKAKTAVLGRHTSNDYAEMINKGRLTFLSTSELECMLKGGAPIVAAGQCIGALGVFGVKPSEDAQVTMAGIAALAPA